MSEIGRRGFLGMAAAVAVLFMALYDLSHRLDQQERQIHDMQVRLDHTQLRLGLVRMQMKVCLNGWLLNEEIATLELLQ